MPIFFTYAFSQVTSVSTALSQLEYEEKEFRSYGLDRGEELLPFKEKKGKLQKQLEEINEAIIAVERSQEAFQKVCIAAPSLLYQAQPRVSAVDCCV